MALFAYFSLGLFAMLESDTFYGVLCGGYIRAGDGHIIYGIGCFSAVIGVLAFAAFQHFRRTVKRRQVCAAFIAAAIAPAAALLFRSAASAWASFIVFDAVNGINTAFCAYCIYRVTQSGKKAGMLVACSTAAALAVVYAVDYMFADILLIKALLLLSAYLGLMYLALRKISSLEVLTQNNAGGREAPKIPADSEKRGFYRMVLAVSAAIAIMCYMIGVNDVAIYSTLLYDPYDAFFTPQLLYIPGLFLAGFLADSRGGKYLPVATLGCTLLTTPIVMRLNTPEVFVENSAITYFLGGFFWIYVIISLSTLAGRGAKPYLVTSLAALLFYVFSGAGAFTSKFFFRADSMLSLSVYLALSAILLIVFFLSGNLQPESPVAASQIPEDSHTQTASLENLVQKYGLTKRETEALAYLLDGEQNTQIAEKMFVTENTVYKYISSMIKKTGVKSRSGLVALFAPTKR